jgi:hypothetical protein
VWRSSKNSFVLLQILYFTQAHQLRESTAALVNTRLRARHSQAPRQSLLLSLYAARPASALPGEAVAAWGTESFGFRINFGLDLAAIAAADDGTDSSAVSQGAAVFEARVACTSIPRLQAERERWRLANQFNAIRIHLQPFFALGCFVQLSLPNAFHLPMRMSCSCR